MQKTKDNSPSLLNNLKEHSATVVAVGALLVPAAIYGSSKFEHTPSAVNPNTPTKPTSDAKVMHQLQLLAQNNPNIVGIAPDRAHPGLDKVSYRFTPNHNTLSDIYTSVSPGQDTSHAMDIVAGYNGGSEITHNGDTVTVEVDTNSGFIVPNPNIKTSADS